MLLPSNRERINHGEFESARDRRKVLQTVYRQLEEREREIGERERELKKREKRPISCLFSYNSLHETNSGGASSIVSCQQNELTSGSMVSAQCHVDWSNGVSLRTTRETKSQRFHFWIVVFIHRRASDSKDDNERAAV